MASSSGARERAHSPFGHRRLVLRTSRHDLDGDDVMARAAILAKTVATSPRGCGEPGSCPSRSWNHRPPVTRLEEQEQEQVQGRVRGPVTRAGAARAREWARARARASAWASASARSGAYARRACSPGSACASDHPCVASATTPRGSRRCSAGAPPGDRADASDRPPTAGRGEPLPRPASRCDWHRAPRPPGAVPAC